MPIVNDNNEVITIDGSTSKWDNYGGNPKSTYGMMEKGNIDLFTRKPSIQDDGSISTVRSLSFNDGNGYEILIPTISPDGKDLTEDEAVSLYYKTGRHLGKFSSSDSATEYAETLHKQQELIYQNNITPIGDLDIATEQPKYGNETEQPGGWDVTGRHVFVKASEAVDSLFMQPGEIRPQYESQKTKSVIDAAFRSENLAVSAANNFINNAQFKMFDDVDGYNPFANEAVELKGYEDYADQFIDSNSPDETAFIKRQIDQRISDKEELASVGGFTSMMASLSAGVVDPVNVAAMLIPIGTAARGASVIGTAGKTALAAGATTAIDEIGLNATQYGVRTPEESALNVFASSLFAGTLGTAGQLIKNRGVRNKIIQHVSEELQGTAKENTLSAAQVFNTTLDQEDLAGLGLLNKTLVVSPAGRLAQSPSLISRQVNQALAENNFTFAKNSEGIASAISVETRIKSYDAFVYKQKEITNGLYRDFKRNPSTNNRLSKFEFSEEIGRAMRNGDSSNIPEVAQAAQQLRPLLEKTKQQMVDLGILKEGVTVKTAASYFPRIYKFDEILKNRAEFKGIIADWFGRNNEYQAQKAVNRLDGLSEKIKASEEARPLADSLGADIKEAERWINKTDELNDIWGKTYTKLEQEPVLNQKLANAELQLTKGGDDLTINSLRTEIEGYKKQIADLEQVKTDFEKLDRSLDIINNMRGFRKQFRELSRKANNYDRLDKSRSRALQLSEPLSREEIEAAADDIVNKIIGAPAGRVPSELIPDSLTKRAGFTKERTLNIPDKLIEKYLESDVDFVISRYMDEIAPEIELTRQFERVDMEDQTNAITEEYNRLISKADPKQKGKLEEQRNADLRDIRAIKDRLLGTYKAPSDPNSFFIRAGKAMRLFNMLRMLGGMTISAIPDMGRPIMEHGLGRSMKTLGTMFSNFDKRGVAKAELREMGVGLEYVLSSRTRAIADLTDPYARRSYFERGLEYSANKFGNFTLMNQWNDFFKSYTGLIAQSRILDNAEKLINGKSMSKADMKKLAQMGLDESMLKRIGEQFKQYGEADNGLKLGHSSEWTDSVVRDAYQSAILKNVDSTIVTPGAGDTPLLMSSETGKLITQFKTFFFASHNRVLAAGVQQGAASFYYGALLSVSVGAAVYVLKSLAAGKEPNLDVNNLIKEGLDRSGVLGYLTEPINMSEAMTGYGLGSLFGAEPVSRYQSRNMASSFLGPTAGTISDINDLTYKVFNGEFDDKDYQKMRRLAPFNNLFMIQPLITQIENKD